MNAKTLILISVFLGGAAQICLKQGLNEVQKRENKSVLGLPFLVLSQPFVWAWGFSFVIATALWLVGLQKVDLSYAYPLVSLGYILVAVLARLFLKERIDRNRWAAIMLLGIGVILIAGS
jgi:drug/metabolite transporter (DMT)-like permease